MTHMAFNMTITRLRLDDLQQGFKPLTSTNAWAIWAPSSQQLRRMVQSCSNIWCLYKPKNMLNMLVSNILKHHTVINRYCKTCLFAGRRSTSLAIFQWPGLRTNLRRSMVTTHAPLAVQNGWVKKAGSGLEPTVTWHADFVCFCPSKLARCNCWQNMLWEFC